MRKSILFALAAALVLALPTFAEAARKKAAAPADPNEPGRRLVADGLTQVFVPLMSVTKSQPAAPAKKGKKKKS